MVSGPYRNRRAIDRTLAALKATGRLEAVDEGTIGLARTLAAAIDDTDPVEKPAQLASLSRAYLATLRTLRGAADNADDGGLSDVLASLRAPSADAGDS